MFNDDDDKNQDLMKSPVYGLITSSPADGLMSSGKDNVKPQLQLYTRDPGNGRIQSPHVGINREDIGEFFRREASDVIIESWMWNQRVNNMRFLYNVFKDCPGLDLNSYMRQGIHDGISKIAKLQDLNTGSISVDEYGEEDDDQT